jgi:intracellular multiplication protein IcmD
MKQVFLTTLAILASYILFGSNAFAQTTDLLGTTDQVRNQLPGVADLISAASYLIGIGFGLKAALKLKEHNESKGQIPLSQPVTLAVVAALLLALPTLLSVSRNSVFGTGSQGSGLDGGDIRQIN